MNQSHEIFLNYLFELHNSGHAFKQIKWHYCFVCYRYNKIVAIGIQSEKLF